MKIDEFIQANASDGQLTTEKAAELLELAMMGDTGTPPESSEAPGAATDEGTQPAADAQADAENDNENQENEPDPANAVIQAKDGVHTIPYDRLVEARQQAQQYKGQLEEQAARLEAMERELEAARAAAQQRADAGESPTQADRNLAMAEQAIEQGVDPELFGDFSEEGIARGVAILVKQQVDQVLREQQLKQQQAQKEQEALSAHDQAIYSAHPDADAIGESRELAEWIAAKVDALPTGVRASARAGYEQVLAKGTAQEVIDLLDTFKRETGRAQPAADVKSAAKAAVASAKAPIPASLSDIPGGTAGPSNKFEVLASLSPAELSMAMADMRPEQIEAFLNRNG